MSSNVTPINAVLVTTRPEDIHPPTAIANTGTTRRASLIFISSPEGVLKRLVGEGPCREPGESRSAPPFDLDGPPQRKVAGPAEIPSRSRRSALETTDTTQRAR